MSSTPPPAPPLLKAPIEREEGISLVTACMNRNGNLIRALPSWLANPHIREIIIVDWSSGIHVAQDIARAGISDPRIRIARVYDEPRWVLSYAFNVGFRLARFDQILKCDADIVLDPSYLAANPLEQGRFIAGNWRTAGEGQQFVNGFFHLHTADLMAVNGFNEYITTYGWDDDDLYERLELNGLTRQDVAPDTVNHLDHEDVARTNQRGVEYQTAWTDLDDQTMFKIRTNRFISTIMPRWTPDRKMRPYSIRLGQMGTQTIRRAGGTIQVVPPHIAQRARQLAAYEMISWRAGIRTFAIPDEQFDMMLSSHRLDSITPLMVELAVAGASTTALTMGRALVAHINAPGFDAPADVLAEAGARLARMAYRSGRILVIAGPAETRPQGLTGPLAAAPYVPEFTRLGDVLDLEFDDVRRHGRPPIVRIHLNEHSMHHLPPSHEVDAQEADEWVRQTQVPADHMAHAAPAVQNTPRDKLYIDAQHGLGNRLRAIGSAGAVARATNRELVVIWQPDHHCDCRMEDLFAYDGEVQDQSFLDHATASGATTLNYMEIEDGADKGAPLTLEAGRDAYVRSAYVLTHPASDWATENQLLMDLRPTPEVLDLLAQAGDPAPIGLHIRMEGAPGTDHNSYDARENWTQEGHAAIHHWRERSHYKHFMARLDTLLKASPDARVFLAADQSETYEVFAQTYGANLSMLNRRHYDRSAQQLRYALADILGLARVSHLLGSNWSSFTEAALRMSDTITTHEVAGRDF